MNLIQHFIDGKVNAGLSDKKGKIFNPIILGKSFYLAKESSIIRLN